MSSGGGAYRALVAGAVWSAFAMLVLGGVAVVAPVRTANAYTLDEAKEIFAIFDANHDGKVTKLEFETYKVDAFYFRERKDSDDPRLRFQDTGLSREFFDKADEGHKGYLTGLDLIDAIHFEDIERQASRLFRLRRSRGGAQNHKPLNDAGGDAADA